MSQVPHDLGFIDEFPASDFTEGNFDLGPEDLLLMATDGVTEAPRDGLYQRGMFNADRLTSLLARMADRPLKEIRDQILRDLEEFTGGTYHDDITFVLARPQRSSA